MFTNIGDVNEEGIILIGSLATVIGEKFTQYLDEFWRYLEHAFKKTKEISLFKFSIRTLSDICKACGKGFKSKLNQTVGFLSNCLNEAGLERSIKICVFDCYGNLALGMKELIGEHLESIMKIYFMAFDASIQF